MYLKPWQAAFAERTVLRLGSVPLPKIPKNPEFWGGGRGRGGYKFVHHTTKNLI
jgi:hypothetical protein